jgi:hypothetical protein
MAARENLKAAFSSLRSGVPLQALKSFKVNELTLGLGSLGSAMPEKINPIVGNFHPGLSLYLGN